MRTKTSGILILVLLLVLGPGVHLASAAVAGDTRPAGPVITDPELNLTGVDIANQSIPSRFGIQPTMIDVRVGVSETSLPAPKGEMATGPRTIGFTTGPVTLAILVVALIAMAAGIWYLVKRGPESEEDENEEGEE